MTEIVKQTPLERAARALFEYEPGPYGTEIGYHIEQSYGWPDQVDAVKLVLRAIREPSLRMQYAGKLCDSADSVWRAMIDAALSELTASPN